MQKFKEYLKGLSALQEGNNLDGNLEELIAEQNEIENALASAVLYEKLLGQNEKAEQEEQEEEDEASVSKRSPYLRFGKRNPAFLRFGRSPYLRFGKRSPAFLRFGRNPAFLRFGRSVQESLTNKSH